MEKQTIEQKGFLHHLKTNKSELFTSFWIIVWITVLVNSDIIDIPENQLEYIKTMSFFKTGLLAFSTIGFSILMFSESSSSLYRLFNKVLMIVFIGMLTLITIRTASLERQDLSKEIHELQIEIKELKDRQIVVSKVSLASGSISSEE